VVPSFNFVLAGSTPCHSALNELRFSYAHLILNLAHPTTPCEPHLNSTAIQSSDLLGANWPDTVCRSCDGIPQVPVIITYQFPDALSYRWPPTSKLALTCAP